MSIPRTAPPAPTGKERLREFRQLVQPWQDRASVKELDKRLALL